MNRFDTQEAFRALGDRLAEHDDKERFKPRASGVSWPAPTAFQVRRLHRFVHAMSGADYRKSKRVYRLATRLLCYRHEDLPRLLFDALILLPEEALLAVEQQHAIINESRYTRGEVLRQIGFVRDGYVRGEEPV